ncbi:hypothetical protein COR50_05685 [Chitinophaga caeni]|uniref:Uncharacterized protein n=1 Tax=Chitinophaga caeni TaxID=2029983 RepID=A0A291QS50_9BACT|nr:hypothetical protein COR50_05685 [Chitinophaga caeni]
MDIRVSKGFQPSKNRQKTAQKADFNKIGRKVPTSEVPPPTCPKGIDLKIIPKSEFGSTYPHLRGTPTHFGSTPMGFRSGSSGKFPPKETSENTLKD